MSQTPQPEDVRTLLKEAMARLRAGNVPSHTLAAELLLMHVLGRDRAWLYAHPEEAVAPAIAEKYFALIAQRVSGVPTQYLTGRQEFWGLEFEVGPGVLIPRPETEHVLEVALARLGPPTEDEATQRGAGMRIADVGTGSGCLAIALACELPGAAVVATDISEAALDYARRNAARHGVASRIQFLQCNLLEVEHSSLAPSPSPLLFDLIVSNPPYVARDESELLPVEVRAHEPAEALFGGAEGHELYQPLVTQVKNRLRAGGIFVVELSYNALARVEPLLASPQDWTDVAITHDLAGIPRVLSAIRKGRN